MPGMQKVWLRITGVIGDTTDDLDDYPDRVMATGRAFIKPNVDDTYREKVEGPDGYSELSLPSPVSVEITNGLITYMGKPFVWLDVPETGWNWNISFADIRVRGEARQIASFNFDLDPATPTQIANAALVDTDPEYYRGENLADLMQFTPPASGVPTVQGPRGYTFIEVTTNGANLVFTLGDPLSTEFEVGPIPALTDAQAAADAAEGFRDEAEGFKNTATTQAGNAASSASAASGSASAASGSASAAAGSASTAAGYVSAFNVTIGTVIASAPGSAASATVTGGPPAWTLNLTLPRGDTGPTGPAAVDATTSVKGLVQLAGDLSGTAAAPTVANQAITAAKIANDTITATQLAANAVGSSELADNAVDTNAIQNLAVTAAKIANDTITATQIAADAVGSSELANDAVDTAAIQNLAVTAGKIANGTITDTQISGSAGVALTKLAGKGASFAIAVQAGTRAVNAFGDLLVGMYVAQPFIIDSIIYQFGTPDASGTSTFKIKKNASDLLTSGQAGITAVNQTDGSSSDAARTFVPTSNNSFAKGDRLGVETLTVGTTPGKVLIVIFEARWL